MKKKIDYKEQLKSPKWQKRRLEIMQRDNFTCQICGATEKQLHVHHTSYLPHTDVWDYDDYRLITLCEDCHKEEHDCFNEVDGLQIVLQSVRAEGFTNIEIKYLLEELITSDLILKLIAYLCKKKGSLYREKKAAILERLAKRREDIKKYIPYKV